MKRNLPLPLFLTLAVLTPLCFGQQRELRVGTIEIGVLAGNSLDGLAASDVSLPGVPNFRVTSPASGTAGIRIGGAANASLIFFGQVGLILGQHVSRPLTNGYLAETNLLNIQYEGGFQQFLRGRYKPVYFMGTVAAFQKRIDTLLTYTNSGQTANPVLQSAASLRLHRADFAVSAGLGWRRRFGGSRFGLAAEARAFFPTSDVKVPIGVANLGLFVDFK